MWVWPQLYVIRVCLVFQESSTWAEKGVAFSSPTDQHSLTSSGAEVEEEGDEQGQTREFVTGSSDDDEEFMSISERRKNKNKQQSGDIGGELGGVGGRGLLWGYRW